MKMKSFGAFAMPIVLAASLAYAMPAIADDAASQAASPSASDQNNNASPSVDN
jgi:hypothetical protein